MRLLSRTLAVGLLVLIVSGPDARAQGDGSSVYATIPKGQSTRGPLDWLIGRRAAPEVQTAPRVDSRARNYQPRRRSTPLPRPGPDSGAMIGPVDPNMPQDPGLPPFGDSGSPPAVVPAVPAQAPVNVAIIGDSLSVFLAQGLQEIYADRPHVVLHKRNREASGLVREDYYDWPKSLREYLATTSGLDALVVMLGSNDRQQLRDELGVHDPRTERWREIYIRRVDGLMSIAKDKSIPLIWVGLPVMRSEKYSADLSAFNDLFRARAQALGVTFVDVWEAFTGEDGSYTVSGPDVDGDIVRLRSADGVHFTKAGARKLAFFADRELQKLIIAKQAKVQDLPLSTPRAPEAGGETSVYGVPSSPGSQPTGFNLPQTSANLDRFLGIPVPEPALTSTLMPRPAQGPVMMLTAPPISAGGHLMAGGGDKPSSVPAERSGPDAGLAPKPGRLDDFRSTSN